MNAVELNNINFAYRKNELILNNISMQVPKGSIYGFLGANGAGKSTTLRLILGLMKPQQGKISVFGNNINDSYPKHLSGVGSMIESASLYEHLSATDNLRIAGKYFGVHKSKIEPILELVKLQDAKKKKVKDFSTGMKQRLGLAIALQHDPELLILDEPTNGLDPNGIIALREILHQLSEQNKTILLSSHILSEVEKIVNRVGIINDGHIAFEGSLAALQSEKSKNLRVRFKVSDVGRAIAICHGYEILKSDAYEYELIAGHRDELAKMVKDLVQNNIDVYEVAPIASDLENMFLSVVNK